MDLVVKWNELIENPLLQNLPYKIELNKFGTISMSPASNRHGFLQFEVGSVIKENRKGGRIITECAILTNEGVRVADVAWASDEFIEEFGDVTPFPKAPEICVKIKSPANSKAEMDEKIQIIFGKRRAGSLDRRSRRKSGILFSYRKDKKIQARQKFQSLNAGRK